MATVETERKSGTIESVLHETRVFPPSAEFMYAVMVDEGARTADRLEAARWLADRGFGKSPQDVELALKGQEAVDVHRFAAFAAKYLPTEKLDEMILCVEATIGAERTLPQAQIPQDTVRAMRPRPR